MIGGSEQQEEEVRSYSEIIELVKVRKPDGKITIVYPYDFIVSLRNIGAKLIPTYENAIAFNTEGLITDEEFRACPEAFGGVAKYLYLNPNFWTDERIKKEHWRFEGIRVLPGKTYIHRNGKISGPFHLYILDIDSMEAYNKLKGILESDFFLNTYVTESYKMKDGITFGYHVYWLEDWNENDNCVSISPDDCKPGGEFEIFTGVKYTQIAGHHRNHINFYYHNVGCKNLKEIQFMIRNGLYNQILDLLKGLLLNPEDIIKRRKSQKKYKDPFYGGRENKSDKYSYDFKNAESHNLTETQIESAALWAYPFYGIEFEDATKHYFHFSTAFVSTLVRQNISGKSIKAIMDRLYDSKPHPKYRKETWYSWCDSSILLWKNGGAILGIPSLKKQIQRDPKYGDEESAEKHIYEILDILNIGRKSKFTKNENDSGLTKQEILSQREHEHDLKLAKEKLSERDVDFAFQCVINQAPYDRTSILQLLHGCFSAFTKTPISHILSSLVPGAGKNYLILLVTSSIPEQYIIMYNRLSDRALFHMPGELVIRKFDYGSGEEQVEPVESYLKELHSRLREIKRKSRKSKTRENLDEIDTIEDEIKDILEAAQKLVTLDNVIQVFLDTPPEGLWEALMSLLSQDSVRDQFYTFTDRSITNQSLGAKTTRLRGAPTIISAGVIDDTGTLRFAEKNRRLVHVNPNTSAAKITYAIQSTNDQRFGLPEENEEDYISSEDKERAKLIFDVIISKIKLHSEQFGFKDPGVYMPKILRNAIRDAIRVGDGKVWSMTTDDRLLRYLTVIALERMDSRLRIYDEETGESRVIPTFSDLERTLQLMNRISSQVRPYVAEFYNDIIIPTYNENEDPNTGKRDGKDVKESVRGISDSQIVDYCKKRGMEVLGKQAIRERFLKPLCNQGILNETKSEIDRRAFIYAPVEGFELGISTLFDDDTDPRLIVQHPECYPSKDKLLQEFLRLSSRSEREKGDRMISQYKIKNFDGDEIDFTEMKNYLGNPEKCFKKGFLEGMEKWRSEAKNSCLGWFFRLLKDQESVGEAEKLTKEAENSDVVDNITIKQKNILEGNRRKTQNTFEGTDPKTLPREPPQYLQTVLNYTSIFQPDIEKLNQSVIQSLSQIRENIHTLTLPNNIQYFENHVSLDFEWYRNDLQSNIDAELADVIYAAAFVDGQGNAKTIHLEDFNGDQNEFMLAILEEIRKYDCLIGYCINEKRCSYKKDGGIDGDIEQLRKNCEMLAPEFLRMFEKIMSETKTLDLFPMFTSGHTKGILSSANKINLRGNSLNAIATTYLGESKLENLTGQEVELLSSSDIQKLYCLQDAILALKLAQKENFKLLRIFSSLAAEAGKDFYHATNSARTSTYWRGLLKKWGYNAIHTELTRWQEKSIERYPETGKIKKGVPYIGGEVLVPSGVGMYLNVTVWDVASMYPTMCIVNNISPETVMCDCCKDDPDARISNEMMRFINNGLEETAKNYPGKGYAPRPFHYWICKKQTGILPQIMKNLFKKKSEHKKRDMTSDEKAVKILANSGYGVFADKHFEEYNIGVAELITGFARFALLGLKQKIESSGLRVIYGDTDSLFVTSADDNLNKIVELAKVEYGIEIEKEKVFKVFIIPSTIEGETDPSQKQYFGLLDNGEIYSTTLVGMKSNFPKYWRDVMWKLIDVDIIEEFYLIKDLENIENKDKTTRVATVVRQIFATLNSAIDQGDMKFVRSLAYTQDNDKPLSAYSNNDWHKQIFEETLEDCNGDAALAEQKTQAHTIIPYWRIVPVIASNRYYNGKRKSWTVHPERYTLDKPYYKDALWKRVEPILYSYGFTKEECTRLKAELVGK